MKKPFTLTLLALLAVSLVPQAAATLLGTVPTPPGGSVLPGLVTSGTPPGTLLASLSAPFVSSLGTNAGTVYSAVYQEAGGTLDFYYHATNNLTATNCGAAGQQPCDPLSRLTATNFFGFLTSLGFRLDGGSFGGPFLAGTVLPITGDRNSVGDVVGFNFNPPDAAKIQPGQTSAVLIISTNAIAFTAGNVSLIDGGTTTVASFEPTGEGQIVPEPSSLVLLAAGLAGVGGLLRRKLPRS